jgi:RNA polymerase sigma-70 factor (ECF subfamily)
MAAEVPSGADAGTLLGRARAGEAAALGRLLETYRARLLLLARLRVGPAMQGKVGASDVVQEAFLQAHRAFPQFRGSSEAEFASWLRRILESRVSKQARLYHGTARRNVGLERALDGLGAASSATPIQALASARTSPSVGASRREQGDRLVDALARLPDAYREVLVLRHFEGLTFPAIAERMGKTLGSVEKLWMRALARLRGLLGEM